MRLLMSSFFGVEIGVRAPLIELIEVLVCDSGNNPLTAQDIQKSKIGERRYLN